MKKRVISGCVTVTGPPRAIWRRKIGITEPDEPRTLPNRTATNRVSTPSRLPHASTIHSREGLRLPHHCLRVRGLVGRDEHEPLRAVLDRGVREDACRERVVADGLERVRLHHRDVLVGRRMEDDARAVLVEHLPQLRRVLHVADHRGRGEEAAVADELPLDLEQRGLGVVEEHELRRCDPGDLAAELRSDRAARARDEHHLACQVARDRSEVDLDRLAPENVLDLDRTELRARGRRRPRRARRSPAAS